MHDYKTLEKVFFVCLFVCLFVLLCFVCFLFCFVLFCFFVTMGPVMHLGVQKTAIFVTKGRFKALSKVFWGYF